MNESLVRASALEGFTETVTALGGDANALLRAAGIPANLSDPDAWISYTALLQLLELAATATDCPHFGLEMSQRQGPSMLGVVGFAMQQAPNVGTALNELASHFAHHNQGAEVSLETSGDLAMLGFRVKDTSVTGSRQQYELSVGAGINIMRILCGQQWSPRAVYFVHSAPSDSSVLRGLLRCPLHFNWEQGMMTFDAADLQKPISQANEHLHRILESHLRQLQQQYPNDISAQVRHLIRQALMTGDCSIERVASFLSMNKRTLQRQLQSVGASYKNLLEDTRFDIATRYLLDSEGSLTDLADMLCYTELSAFSNAFKQRFGLSPRDWKKAHSTTAAPSPASTA